MKCDTCKFKPQCDYLERSGKIKKHDNCSCYAPTVATLVGRLREVAEMMRRGVFSPGHIAAVCEAANALEIMVCRPVQIETDEDREFRDYCCPRCHVTISQEYKGPAKLRPGLYMPKYCADCGQALIWPERKVENADV